MSQIIVQLNPDVPPTGSDLGIVNAARKSFGKRSEIEYVTGAMGYYKLKDKDKRLLEFLARGMTAKDFTHFLDEMDNCVTGGQDEGFEKTVEKLWEWRNTPTHASPFGHAFMSFELKIPMFLARQLVKHKFLRWSEYSRRYITDDVEFYKHAYRTKAEDVKQGSGGSHKNSEEWQKTVDLFNQNQLGLYNSMIKDGIAPEQARGVLPADLMTALTWSGSLDAFADMCRLRLGSDAQKEAQLVAEKVYEHLKKQFPVSAPLLVEGVF